MIVQGTRTDQGPFHYTVDFTESAEGPTAVLVWVAAVNPDTCEFELQRATFDAANLVAGDSESLATLSAEDEVATVSGAGSSGNTDTDDVGTESARNAKLTVVGKWEDFVGIDVNKVLAAVRSFTQNGDIVGAKCRYAWWWRVGTGWEYPGDGRDFVDCRSSDHQAKALADGHFKNSLFPTCIPDTVHVY
jgi:hypothetical protein